MKQFIPIKVRLTWDDNLYKIQLARINPNNYNFTTVCP